MLTLKNSVNGLRGVLMALAAVVSLSVASPRVEAAPPTPAQQVVDDADSLINNVYSQTRARLVQIRDAATAAVTAADAVGANYAELRRIAASHEKQMKKACKEANKQIRSIFKQAKRELRSVGGTSVELYALVGEMNETLGDLDNYMFDRVSDVFQHLENAADL